MSGIGLVEFASARAMHCWMISSVLGKLFGPLGAMMSNSMDMAGTEEAEGQSLEQTQQKIGYLPKITTKVS